MLPFHIQEEILRAFTLAKDRDLVHDYILAAFYGRIAISEFWSDVTGKYEPYVISKSNFKIPAKQESESSETEDLTSSLEILFNNTYIDSKSIVIKEAPRFAEILKDKILFSLYISAIVSQLIDDEDFRNERFGFLFCRNFKTFEKQITVISNNGKEINYWDEDRLMNLIKNN
jgi:hypothetical protein